MPKIWQRFDDECLHCGGGALVLTDSGEDNVAYDGDTARCEDCGCPGQVVVEEALDDDDTNEARVEWHDAFGCDCEWCNENPS